MTDKDLNDSHKSRGKGRDENETHRGWKSKWVESTPPRDVHGSPDERPDDVRYDGSRLNPPERDDVPGDGGAETT